MKTAPATYYNQAEMGCIKCHQRWVPNLDEQGNPLWQHECVVDLAERVRKLEQRIELVATDPSLEYQRLKSAQSDPKRKANT